MSFCERVKKAFCGKKAVSSSGSSSPPKRKDIEYYAPGKIPSSKYRGPWDQNHQDKLHAFSFENAYRQRQHSIPPPESPRGTLAPSGRSSWMSRTRSRLGGRRELTEDGLGPRRQSHAIHVDKWAEEGEGDDDDDDETGNAAIIEQGNSGRNNTLEKQEERNRFTAQDLTNRH